MENTREYFKENEEELKKRTLELANGSKFYKRLLRRSAKKIEGGEAFNFNFFNELPKTTKDDLKRNHPFGFLAVDQSEIRGYFESSGTTDESIGSSMTCSYKTEEDLKADWKRRLPEWMLKDLNKGDFAVIHLPYALTSSGIAFHEAFREQGITPVALDQGHTFSSYTRVYSLLKSLQAKVLVCSVPFLLRDIVLYDQNVDIFELPNLKYILTVGTALSDESSKYLEEKYNIKVGKFYGMSEFGAVGVPCSKSHIHVQPDFYFEINNPNNTEANFDEDSIGGEILITDMKSKASPMLKYRTGDSGRIFYKKCDCEFNTPCVEVYGRLKDVIQNGDKGFLFPTTFQDLLIGKEDTSPVHKVVAKGDSEIELELHIQQYKNNPEEVEQIKEELKQLTDIPVEVVVYKFGELFEDIYAQNNYRTTQKVKTMSFHDERKGEWIITY